MLCLTKKYVIRYISKSAKICVYWQDHRPTSNVMKSWQAYQYGSTDQLNLSTSIRVPLVARPDELLIEIHAASVNPIDAAMLGGYGASTILGFRRLNCSFQHQLAAFPLTLGRDFSGVVVDSGQGPAAELFRKGDEVWGTISPLSSVRGSHAEYATVPYTECADKPVNLTHIEAASLPYVACTAWAAIVTFGRLSQYNAAGKRILLLGSGGGLGTFAIQLLKVWGAHVTTTCSDDMLETVLKLGADVAIDYKTANLHLDLKDLPKFDMVFNAVYDDASPVSFWMSLLKSNFNAHYVTINSPLLKNNDMMGFPQGLVKSTAEIALQSSKYITEGKHIRWAFFIPSRAALQHITGLVETGKIKPVIQKVFPFEEVPMAVAEVAKRQGRGKMVIEVKS